MKPQLFRVEQIKAAKRYVWNLYSHKKWFCGALYRRDEEDDRLIIGVDVLIDPECTDRMTIIGEHEDVPIRPVNWDPEVHGERFDARKEAENGQA